VAFTQAGVWAQVAGVMVGSFTDMRDNTVAHGQSVDNPFGMTAEEILASHLGPANCPVEWGVPAGHGARNAPFILG
jgi:muramoyltetrapeptide carboxypeptidase